jgi:WD40 repeat protein
MMVAIKVGEVLNLLISKGKGQNGVFFAAGDDGFIRACEIYSSGNGISRVFARHAEDVDYAVPIVCMDVSHCGNFLATSGHDMSISFFDISELNTLAKDTDFGVEYKALKKKEEVENEEENWDDQDDDKEGGMSVVSEEDGEDEEEEEEDSGMVQEN